MKDNYKYVDLGTKADYVMAEGEEPKIHYPRLNISDVDGLPKVHDGVIEAKVRLKKVEYVEREMEDGHKSYSCTFEVHEIALPESTDGYGDAPASMKSGEGLLIAITEMIGKKAG